MIKINKALMQIEGDSVLVATETSMLLTELRKKDKSIIPVILSCLYSHGGSKSLEDTLKAFKEDTTDTIKKFEEIERAKNGRH